MAAPRTIRICFLLDVYPPEFGGHAIQTRRTLPYLETRGIAPTVLTRQYPATSEAGRQGADRQVLRLLARGTTPLARVRRILQLRHHFRINPHRYDIVHSVLTDWEFLLNLPFLKSLGLPVVLEMVLLGGDDPATVARERFGALKMSLLRSVDAWVGISRAFLPSVTASGIPANRFRTIYGGVDVETYRPPEAAARRGMRAKFGIPPDARVVMSVGALIRRKGMERVLNAWSRLMPLEGRDVLLILGPSSIAQGLPASEAAHAAEVQALARTIGAGGTVRFLGRADHVHEYMAAADLFLLLSRQEGLATSILEAMSCGLACVVSPLDGIELEVIQHGVSGFIVENPDDSAAVATCVSRILREPALRSALGEAARRTVVERFSFTRRADALATLYQDVLGDVAGREPRTARSS